LHRNTQAIGTADLLVGMTHDKHQPDCPFAFLYDRREEIRTFCEFPPLSGEKKNERNLPLTETSKTVLAYAAQEADHDQRYGIDEEHLFRGLLLANDATSTLLLRLGYSLDTARAASIVAQQSQPDIPKPRALRARRLLRSNALIAIAALAIAAAVLYMHFQK